MFYVYSTLTSSNDYAIYEKNNAKDLPKINRVIRIEGGSNVANKNLITPRGVVTSVSDSNYEALKENYHFKKHLENGFLSVVKKEVKIEKVISSLEKKDKSAPKTPNDVEFVAHKSKVDKMQN